MAYQPIENYGIIGDLHSVALVGLDGPIDVSTNGHGRHELIRRVEVVRGEMVFRMECSPAFDYARDGHETEIGAEGASFHSPRLSLGLAAGVPLKRRSDGVVAEFTLREERMAVFVLRQIEPGDDCGVCFSEREEEELFKRTIEYWRRWLSKSTYTGRWREMG